MKAVWKGNISFALVSIPVKLYSTVESRASDFHMLHDRCGAPLHYERHCDTCGEVVPWESVVRGYEYEKNKFVVVTEEEMENLPQAKSKSIDILEFVNAEEIDPIHFDKAYYVEPQEGAEGAYVILREVLEKTGMVPLAKVTLRDKEHVAAIMIHEGALTLYTLYYADEIRSVDALNIPEKAKVGKKEMGLATELVKKYAGKLDIEQFHDRYREALMELVKAKVEGREVKVAPAREPGKIINLMDALNKSLGEKEKARKKKKVARAKIVGRKKRKAG